MNKKYVVRIDEPKNKASEGRERIDLDSKDKEGCFRAGLIAGRNETWWPKYIDVPPFPPCSYPTTAWTPPSPLEDPAKRNTMGMSPQETWMIEKILPIYPGSVCTLMESLVEYEPTTHVRCI